MLYMSHLPTIRIMADYAAEIEVRSDGEAEREELTNYDEVQDYLANGTCVGTGTTSSLSVSSNFQQKANSETVINVSSDCSIVLLHKVP